MTSNSNQHRIRSRLPVRIGWALGGAALLVWFVLLGIRFLQPAPTSWAEPIVRPKVRQTPGPAASPIVLASVSKRAALPSSDEAQGPKVVEQREPIDHPTRSSADSDPGPGPHMQYYGGRSGRLSPNAVAHVSGETGKSVSKGKGAKLVVWASKSRVTIGQPVTIRAVVVDGSGHLTEPDRITIALAPLGHAAEAPSNPMPAAPAGDESQFAYTTVAAPPDPSTGSGNTAPPIPNAPTPTMGGNRVAPPQEYEFVVRAKGSADGTPFEKVAGGYFLVQKATASLDPSSTNIDFVRGNLKLSVGVHVEGAGNYMASAELWAGAAGDKPVAFARQRLEGLSPGTQSVALLFGGRVIRDSQMDGPYIVRNIQLMQVDSIPPHGAEPISELPKTRAFRASDFY